MPDADSRRIKRVSLEELLEMKKRGEVHAPALNAAELELDDSFWDEAYWVMPGEKSAKASVHLRLDPEVFDWFKAQGKGHLTRMQAVLRAYVRAQKRKLAK